MPRAVDLPPPDERTYRLPSDGPAPALAEQRFFLVVRSGPSRGRILALPTGEGARFRIGKASDADLSLPDGAVSRAHCELRREGDGWIVKDLRSTNGTTLDGSRVREAYLRSGAILGVGQSALLFTCDFAPLALPPSTRERFGALIGGGLRMREVFALLEKVSASDSTLLVTGETGTGKSTVARAVHDASARAAGPFVVLDCGAIAPTLIESELFGHERGAFTGADQRRAGALEQAHGGTLFIDELDDLRKDLQAKLLRALEERTFQRLGADKPTRFAARVIAASKKDLRALVEKGLFREDLYFRLALFHVELPPLRLHGEDLPALVDHFGRSFGREHTWSTLTPGLRDALFAHSWPGNVRELRNAVERAFALGDGGVPNQLAWGLTFGVAGPAATVDPDYRLPYKEAREALTDRFEREYLIRLLARCDGNVTRAAREAGINRSHIYTLAKKHGLADVVLGRDDAPDEEQPVRAGGRG